MKCYTISSPRTSSLAFNTPAIFFLEFLILGMMYTQLVGDVTRRESPLLFHTKLNYHISVSIRKSAKRGRCARELISLVLLSLTSVSWCQEHCSEPTCFTFYLRCWEAKGPVHCRICLQIRRMLEVLCLLYCRLHRLIFMIRTQQKSGGSLSKLGRITRLP